MSRLLRPLVISFACLLGTATLLLFSSTWPKHAAAERKSRPPAALPRAEAASAPAPAPLVAPPGNALHTVQKGQSLRSVVHAYLSDSSYMTGAELEAAIRAANHLPVTVALKPGVTLVIPGMPGPITEHPVPIAKDYEVRAIYLTGTMAGSHVGLELMRRWRAAGGNAVVFDVKDSDGIVNIRFDDPLNVGGPRPTISNLPKFTRWLHRQGLHAIARIAIFRDERLVTRHPELGVRSRSTGQAWRENGKLVWADPSRPEVQKFNIALARKAAEGGVDEIQFDYVRFPAEGDQKDAQFYFESHPLHAAKAGQPAPEPTRRTDVITDFLAKAYAEVHPLDVLFSLDVFGVMAWQRPVDLAHTGQDIPGMARHCDVLSPMIYPSHFFGMDGYKIPGDAPEHFISESLERFRQITAASGVVLRPWLQAFGWRTPSYSPQYVETQVSVARQHGGIGFLFWNARNDYSKPFSAMPAMRHDPKFFRGDEVPGTKTAAAMAAVPVRGSQP